MANIWLIFYLLAHTPDLFNSLSLKKRFFLLLNDIRFDKKKSGFSK